ncbi:MAG: MFS transporter [Anaerolineae bacterium]|nr:MFS transporter [Anaerolineae bacterium]
MSDRRSPSMFALNAYWFAISYLWNSLGPIVLPVLVGLLVPEAIKGSALGLLTAIGMVTAIIVQPVAGAISDRSTSRWGRRRPYILGGTLADMVFLLAIALAPRYWFLVLAYFGLQVSSNIAHGPYQGLIPDLVPAECRGSASGVKQLAEILGIIVTSLAAGLLMSRGQTLVTILSIMAVLLVTAAITVWGVREEPLAWTPSKPLWSTVLDTFRVDLRRHMDFVWLIVSRLLIIVAMNLVRNYVVYYMQHVLRLSLQEAAGLAGNLLAIVAVSIAVIVYPAGMLSDRVGRRSLLVASGLLGALGSLLLLWVRSYVHLLVFGGILGLSMGVFLSVNWALLMDVIPDEEAGRYLGLSNLATAGAGAVAGIGGPIIDIFNAQVAGRGFVVLYILAALCYLVGTAILARVRAERRAARSIEPA